MGGASAIVSTPNVNQRIGLLHIMTPSSVQHRGRPAMPRCVAIEWSTQGTVTEQVTLAVTSLPSPLAAELTLHFPLKSFVVSAGASLHVSKSILKSCPTGMVWKGVVFCTTTRTL